MDMVEIVTSVNEINASIIKNFLEVQGIKCTYAPNVSRFGRVASCAVFCPKDKAEEALKLLKEQGLIAF